MSQKKGGTQAELARVCKVKPASVSDWFHGRSLTMGGSQLLAASDYFGVRPRWLANGIGPMRGSAESSALLAQEPNQDFSIDWPFATISEDEWKSIPTVTKNIIEQQIKSLIPNATRQKIRA